MDRAYRVGGHGFRVSGERLAAALDRTEGFRPFADGGAGSPAFAFAEVADAPPAMLPLYAFGHEGVGCAFGRTGDGFRLTLRPEGEAPLDLWTRRGEEVVRLAGDCSVRLVRFALWVGYGLMTAGRDTVAVHSSCVVHRGRAVLFLGESGTGKSTHTRLWREHVAGCGLLNDDSPVVRVEDGVTWVYGSPWSGKTPCYRAERYPLAGCVRLSQAPHNRMARLDTLRAYAALHPSAPPAFAYDGSLYDGVSRTLGRVVAAVPVFRLACRPDREAAELACRTLFETTGSASR